MPHHDTLAPVERLYARLTDALQRSRPDAFAAPVTVAEIYQELVPYRLVRTEVGFDMNADYEHALLRLLAGEAGCVRLDPPEAAEEIGRELRSTNPNLSLYREYAGCDAWVRPPAARASASAGSGAPRPDDGLARNGGDPPPEKPLAAYATFALADGPAPSSSPPASTPPDAEETDPWDDDGAAEDAGAAAAAPSAATLDRSAGEAVLSAGAIEQAIEEVLVSDEAEHRDAPAEVETAVVAEAAALRAPAAPHCPFCDSELPRGRAARFCPYCGEDQTKRPCGSCGEAVEAGWVYCIACGVASP